MGPQTKKRTGMPTCREHAHPDAVRLRRSSPSRCGLRLWGGTAPIAGAIVASGVFVATGQNKIVQHLEGGVIQRNPRPRGRCRQQGQTLVHLDETVPTRRTAPLDAPAVCASSPSRRACRRRSTTTRRSRSRTEFATKVSDPDVRTIVESQRLTFDARRKNFKSEIASIREGIERLEQRVDGTKTQLAGVRRQMSFIEEELEGKSQLLKSGLIRKPEVLALQRAQRQSRGRGRPAHRRDGRRQGADRARRASRSSASATPPSRRRWSSCTRRVPN